MRPLVNRSAAVRDACGCEMCRPLQTAFSQPGVEFRPCALHEDALRQIQSGTRVYGSEGIAFERRLARTHGVRRGCARDAVTAAWNEYRRGRRI